MLICGLALIVLTPLSLGIGTMTLRDTITEIQQLDVDWPNTVTLDANTDYALYSDGPLGECTVYLTRRF
ncbi:hypothetical protein [Propionibacterium freudenreichii]|uniref:hypothetical protein n=1 Tax=Propionibacterium freudenreichii TaxID=1744 RepID=UPI003853DE3C